jgi:hypothetical protein
VLGTAIPPHPPRRDLEFPISVFPGKVGGDIPFAEINYCLPRRLTLPRAALLPDPR